MKALFLAVLLFVTIGIQVHFSPSGYNYFVYWLGCILIAYFNEIKSFSFATFKIEKYEETVKYLEETVVAAWKTKIDLSMFSGGVFSVITPEIFFQVIESIQKEMPQKIQDRLNEYVKQKAKILAIHQNRKIKTYKTSQPNILPDAEKAFKKLCDIEKNGLEKFKS